MCIRDRDKLIEQVMNAQTSQIDGVTGATVTSKAVPVSYTHLQGMPPAPSCTVPPSGRVTGLADVYKRQPWR